MKCVRDEEDSNSKDSSVEEEDQGGHLCTAVKHPSADWMICLRDGYVAARRHLRSSAADRHSLTMNHRAFATGALSRVLRRGWQNFLRSRLWGRESHKAHINHFLSWVHCILDARVPWVRFSRNRPQ